MWKEIKAVYASNLVVWNCTVCAFRKGSTAIQSIVTAWTVRTQAYEISSLCEEQDKVDLCCWIGIWRDEIEHDSPVDQDQSGDISIQIE